MKIRSPFGWFVLATLLFSAFYMSTRVRGAQQNVKNRTIARLPIERNEPVRIRVVKVKGAKVFHRQKFLADDDWLSDLTVTIKNRTAKTIIFAAIDLQFPRPRGSEGPTAIHTIEYGNRALLTRRAGADERSSRIAPGQSADLALTPHDVNGIRFLLSATGYHSGPERLHLSVGHVSLRMTLCGTPEVSLGGTQRIQAPGLTRSYPKLRMNRVDEVYQEAQRDMVRPVASQKVA